MPNPAAWLGIMSGTGALDPVSGLQFFTTKLAPFLVSVLLYGLVSLSLIFLIVGGIMYMTSGGNKEATAKAKAAITYALIGLILGVSSFIILSIVGTFFGSKLI